MAKKRLNAWIDDELYTMLKIYAAERGISVTMLVTRNLERYRNYKPAQHIDNVKAEMAAILAQEQAQKAAREQAARDAQAANIAERERKVADFEAANIAERERKVIESEAAKHGPPSTIV